MVTLHIVCLSIWPGIAVIIGFGKTRTCVARAPCGLERLSSGLNILDRFRPFLDIAHPLTCPSAYLALKPRRASHTQPDDRV